MKRTITAFFVACFLAGVAAAQMPAPGPEQKRLEYFAGTWRSEYEISAGPAGPGGKMTATDRSEMMPGGFFLITHTEGNGTMGEMKSMAVMGYDAQAKTYTYDSFNNFGEAEHFKGTVQGDTWTWTSEGNSGGKPKMRFTAKEVSSTMYSMKLEILSTGGVWLKVMGGRATKGK